MSQDHTHTESITLDAKDRSGRPIKAQVRARLIDIPNPYGGEEGRSNRTDSSYYPGAPSAHTARRGDMHTRADLGDLPTGQGRDGDAAQPLSREGNDDPLRSLAGIIPPPYPLRQLAELVEMSSELRKAAAAMVTNTVGFGSQFKKRPMTAEQEKAFADEIIQERQFLDAVFQTLHPTLSFRALRQQAAWDKWTVGNGYLELLNSPTGRLVGVDHIRGHTVYLMHQDKQATPIDVPVVLPHEDFRVMTVTRRHRFRRFVQVLSDGSKVYFKEAGDPRTMSWRTGEFAEKSSDLPYDDHATSLIHDKCYATDSAYGIPPHVAEEESIRGSFEASRVNFNTISDNNVPSMFVVVENGMLTEGSIERLKQFTEQQAKKAKNYSKFVLLEGSVDNEGAPVPGQFRIRVEPLKQLQAEDALFQQYDKNNNEKVRQSFRVAPIFVGNVQEYNKATADAARDLTDEQVFAPARDETDWFINRFVLPAWGIRFHTFRSATPNVTNAFQLLKMAGMTERSGGMTPRLMRLFMETAFGEELGPLPAGIDPDVPYSTQHAIAQKQGGLPQSSNPALQPPLEGLDPSMPDAVDAHADGLDQAERALRQVEIDFPEAPETQAEQLLDTLLALRNGLADAIQRKHGGDPDNTET